MSWFTILETLLVSPTKADAYRCDYVAELGLQLVDVRRRQFLAIKSGVDQRLTVAPHIEMQSADLGLGATRERFTGRQNSASVERRELVILALECDRD